jgi:predicted nucleotidyltransferase
MRPSEILKLKRAEIHTLLSRHPKFANLRVFGSVVKGEDVEGSDIDFVVDTLPGTTLFHIARLKIELEDMLGVSVDILTSESDMNYLLKYAVWKEAVRV